MRIKEQKQKVSTIKIIATCIAISFSFQIHAAETYEFYNGIRQMGMGGASIAVVNDETALLANPAALGKLRDSFTTLFDPEVDYGKENSAIATGNAIFSAFTAQGLLDKLREHPNKHFHMRAQMFPSFVTANFGVGIYAKYAVDGEYDAVPDPDVVHFDLVNDLAFVLGYNFRIWDGRIKFGFNAKYINRIEMKDQDPAIDPATTDLLVKNDAKEGGAMSADVGLIIAMPWKLLPTLAIVAHDVGNTSFNFAEGIIYNVSTERPDVVKQTYDAAFAIFPVLTNRTRITFTGEYRDVTNVNEETDMAKKIHAGIEVNFSDMIFVRAGYNQRYWTAGLEFAYERFQFQLASYGEEIGTLEENREDRRYSVKFSYRY